MAALPGGAMLIKCGECGKDISDKAAACPSCGAPMAASVGGVPTGGVASEPVAAKSGGGAWKWVVGVPVLLVVLFLGFGATRPVDPERERAKAVYEGCKDQLASTDRARLDTARTLAAICDGYRADYIRKYQRNP